MKTLRLIIPCLLIAFVASSCKKDYDCSCTNSSGTYIAGTTKDTKSRAKKYCEGLSSGETKCKLK